jgi:DNA invertase Pin-like site-specific DNA recombinase
MLLGYARVSTVDQNLALQRDALTEAGCTKIFTEQMSGAVRDRPALHDALEFARSGDTLIVWKLDRLARSMKQLIETVETLRLRGIGFRSLTEALDTTTAQGRLVFHMFGALAEFERSLIRERTRAGLAAARRAGRTGGRPPKLTDDDIEAAKAMLANPDIGVTQIAHRLGSHRRRSIGTSRPREPRIRRAFDNGRSSPKAGRSPRVSAWRRAAAVRPKQPFAPS